MKNFVSQFEDLSKPVHGVRLPNFEIENKYKRANELSEDVDNYDFLRGLCLKGFKNLKLRKNTKKYKEYANRVKSELEILIE